MSNVLSYKAFLMKKYQIDAETAEMQVGLVGYIVNHDEKSKLIEDMIAYRSEYHKWEGKSYKTVDNLEDESIIDACDNYAKYLTLVLPETLYVNSAILIWLQKWGYGAHVALSYTAQEVIVRLSEKHQPVRHTPLELVQRYVKEKEETSEVKSVIIGADAIDRAVHSLAGGNSKADFEDVSNNNGTLNGVPYETIKKSILEGTFRPGSTKETQDASAIINSVSAGIPFFITSRSGKRVAFPVDGDLDALRFDNWRLAPRPATQEAYLKKIGMDINASYSDNIEKQNFLSFFEKLTSKELVEEAVKKNINQMKFFSASWLDGGFLKKPFNLLYLSYCHFKFIGKASQYPSWVYLVKQEKFLAPNMFAGFFLLVPKFLKIMTLYSLCVKKTTFMKDLERVSVIYGCSALVAQLQYTLAVFNEEVVIDLRVIISEKKKAAIDQINLMSGNVALNDDVYKDELDLKFKIEPQDEAFMKDNAVKLKQVLEGKNDNKYREKLDPNKGKRDFPPPPDQAEWINADEEFEDKAPEGEGSNSNIPNNNNSSIVHIPHVSDKNVKTGTTSNNNNQGNNPNPHNVQPNRTNVPNTRPQAKTNDNVRNNNFVNRKRGTGGRRNNNNSQEVPTNEDYNYMANMYGKSDVIDSTKDFYND